MSIQQVQELLDSHNIKYMTISYSSAHTAQELENYQSRLGTDLIEAVLVEIQEKKIAMAVIPASRQINLGSLQQALGTNQVRMLDFKEVEKLFPDCQFGTVPPFGNLYGMDVFLAQDLDKNQQVKFYVNSYAHLFQINYKDFKNLVNFQKEIVFSTKSRYRALVKSLSPKVPREELENYDHCFLGVSLENKEFSTEKLVAITDWIARYFSKCTVFIADSMYRITLQIDQDLKENQSLNKALLLGREYIERKNTVFEGYADSCIFDVLFSSEVQKSEQYTKYYQELQHLVKKNDKFANSVKSCARYFVLRYLEQDTEYFERYVEKSCTYLLEELAVTACLVQYGLSIMIYPGSLATIFGEIAEGNHPDVPHYLQKMICVSLHIKKR